MGVGAVRLLRTWFGACCHELAAAYTAGVPLATPAACPAATHPPTRSPVCTLLSLLPGGMFNIIRGVPLVGYDARKRQAMLFMAGQGTWQGGGCALAWRLRGAAISCCPASKPPAAHPVQLPGWRTMTPARRLPDASPTPAPPACPPCRPAGC